MVKQFWKAPNGSIFYRVNEKGLCEKIEKIKTDDSYRYCDYAITFRMENGEEKTFYYDYDDGDLYLTPKEAVLGNICKFEKHIKGLEWDIECLKSELEEYKEKLKVLNQQRGSFNN